MHSLRSAVRSFQVGIAVVLVAMTASASPVLLNAGDVVTLNFDAASFVPYSFMTLDLETTGLNSLTDSIDIKWFAEQDGAGMSSASGTGALNALEIAFPDIPTLHGFFDGVFSAVVTDLHGSFSADVWAVVNTGTLDLPVLHRIDASHPVDLPEPASMVLLGTALASLWLSRRRTK